MATFTLKHVIDFSSDTKASLIFKHVGDSSHVQFMLHCRVESTHLEKKKNDGQGHFLEFLLAMWFIIKHLGDVFVSHMANFILHCSVSRKEGRKDCELSAYLWVQRRMISVTDEIISNLYVRESGPGNSGSSVGKIDFL